MIPKKFTVAYKQIDNEVFNYLGSTICVYTDLSVAVVDQLLCATDTSRQPFAKPRSNGIWTKTLRGGAEKFTPVDHGLFIRGQD